MVHHLVVIKPFLSYVRGDIISDAAKVRDILATERKKSVIKVATPTTSKG